MILGSAGPASGCQAWPPQLARPDCPASDPNGKLDIVRCAGYWFEDAAARGIQHICLDGCMFPNSLLETQDTWNDILDVMLRVRAAHGWTSQVANT